MIYQVKAVSCRQGKDPEVLNAEMNQREMEMFYKSFLMGIEIGMHEKGSEISIIVKENSK